MEAAKPDFGGYATKANLKCSDGRTILPDAFKHQDKMKVPLVYQHARNELNNVLGHAILENRDDGVYCWGYFNDSPEGKAAKVRVQHEDLNSLSIYANKLIEKSKAVMHGMIREVSLVVAGANPGALIDQVAMQHDDGTYDELEDEAIIYTGLSLEHGEEEAEDDEEEETDDVTVNTEEGVEHAASTSSEKTVKDVFDTLTDEQKNVVYYMIGEAMKGSKSGNSGTAAHSEEELNAIFHSFNDEQREVAYFIIGEALEQADSEEEPEPDDAAAHADDTEGNDSEADAADDQEGNTVTHNVFEDTEGATKTKRASLSHADTQAIFKAAQKNGSLKEAFEHWAEESDALEHGIDDIDLLFPDAKAITTTPEFIARRQEWVNTVLTGTRHTPFSRIKSLNANLTFQEARAKGYIKGNLKKEEFFRISRRITTPQTIYKKQKLDRDDILDITDFDVVVWLKGEMRLMLEEELARAILVSDGRPLENADGEPNEDKISEDHIRSIANDDELYVTRLYAQYDPEADPSSDAQQAASVALIDSLTLNRRYYRGSGNPTLFTSEAVLAQLLMIKDGFGRRIYQTSTDLATTLRVQSIVPVEAMDDPANNVLGVIVNLQDYNVGADRGGEVSLFDDFDIDYNQNKYLIETRVSGALVKAKSALVIVRAASTDTLVDPTAPTWDATAHSVTVPTVAGVTYKDKLSNTTLTTAAPVTLAEGEELYVIAQPTAGNYFASTVNDEWLFTYENGREDGIVS